MPRWNRRQRVPRAPKPPKAPKLARPKSRDLRMIYKGLLTVSMGQRCSSMAYALQWYDGAIPYLLQKNLITPEGKEKLQRAVNCRKRGISTNHEPEKETAFKMALKTYEKVAEVLKPPSVQTYFDMLEKKRTQLEQKQSRLMSKHGTVLELLQKIVGTRIKLEVADAEKPFQYNPSLTTLSLNRDSVKALSDELRQQGLLSVVANSMNLLSRHAAIEPDGQGGYQYDPAQHVEVMDTMWKSFAQFCRTQDAPKRLVRFGVVRQPLAPGAQPMIRRQSTGPRGPRGGERVAGRYIAGTTMALLYERLQDGQMKKVPDILQGVPAADPMSRLKALQGDGQKFGTWTITINNDDVQMVLTPLPQTASAPQAQGVQP